VGWGKVDVLEHKSGNISETRKDRLDEKLLWRAYRNSPTLLRTAQVTTVHCAVKISNGHNSVTLHPIHFMFASRAGFSGTAHRTEPFPVGSNSRWRPAAILENFKCPYLSNALPASLYVRYIHRRYTLPSDALKTLDAL